MTYYIYIAVETMVLIDEESLKLLSAIGRHTESFILPTP